MYSANSPAAQNEFNNLLKTNPDIYTVTDWLKNNLNTEELIDYDNKDPEEIYDYTHLEHWATKNGWKYKPEIDDFPDSELCEWAEEHDYTRNENIQKVIKDSLCRFSLQFVDREWIIFDSQSEETILSGDNMGELEEECGKYLGEIKKAEIRRVEELLAAKNVAKKRGRKPKK
jgi:hypothetical protein